MKGLLAFTTSPPSLPSPPQPVTFSVSRASKPAVVAGALAARAREGLVPALTAIGEDAVCNAAVAVCRARLYLEDDGLDVRFLATVEPVTKTHNSDGKEHTLDAMKFRIYVERVEAAPPQE